MIKQVCFVYGYAENQRFTTLNVSHREGFPSLSRFLDAFLEIIQEGKLESIADFWDYNQDGFSSLADGEPSIFDIAVERGWSFDNLGGEWITIYHAENIADKCGFYGEWTWAR
jgi:hypothetical protein